MTKPNISTPKEKQDDNLTKELNKAVMKSIKPYVYENVRLNRLLEVRDNKITELQNEISRLQTELDNFPSKFERLSRDEPMERKFKEFKSEDGSTYPFTRYYCPVCDNHISNWEKYCNLCGQRLK